MSGGSEARPRVLAVCVLGLFVLLVVIGGVLLDGATGWFRGAFLGFCRLFYEKSALAEVRSEGQLAVARVAAPLLGFGLGLILLAWPWAGRRARLGLAIGYAALSVRLAVWVVAGTWPLVPGDSCHYLETGRSVAQGLGPVKHYVESYFRDYPAIRQGKGVLDDWATPLWAYLLGGLFRVTGVTAGTGVEELAARARGLSLAFNLGCLPLLYILAKRVHGERVAWGATAVLALLPVHAIYGAFELRESVAGFTAVLAVMLTRESWWARGGRGMWGYAVLGGMAMGLAILARNTGMALAAAAAVHGLIRHGRRWRGAVLAWAGSLGFAIAPWAWATYQAYGEPFYTYTKYFAYNFSWTVHHYEKGNTRADQFFTRGNWPEILRVKIRALGIIGMVSTMILGLPLAAGLAGRFAWRQREGVERDVAGAGRDYDRLVFLVMLAFVAGTLAQVADVTQVEQLGRYYMPVFVLALPTAVAGLLGLLDRWGWRGGKWLAGATLAALWWSNPGWAYDATWLARPYQLHWPGLQAAGEWIRSHPEAVPPEARVLTWFPWEMRVVSDRITVLFPRSYYPPHIERAMRQYGVTHVLWGSFEPPGDVDPETWGPYLTGLREGLGLTEQRLIYQSDKKVMYPVRLYRLSGAAR